MRPEMLVVAGPIASGKTGVFRERVLYDKPPDLGVPTLQMHHHDGKRVLIVHAPSRLSAMLARACGFRDDCFRDA